MLFREFTNRRYTSFPFLCGMMMGEKDGLLELTVNYPIQTYGTKVGQGYEITEGPCGPMVGTSHDEALHVQCVAGNSVQLRFCTECWDLCIRQIVGLLLADKLSKDDMSKVWCGCGQAGHALTYEPRANVLPQPAVCPQLPPPSS